MGRWKKPRFTKEQRAEAVRLVRVTGQSIKQVARDLGISDTALRNWIKQVAVDEGSGPPEALRSDEKEELHRLRRDNRRLRMERDFLKKATAFFAKENSDDLK